jgi:membrane-associated progesterone receptor component
LRLGLTLHPK